MKPLISIIVPVYKVEEYLCRCIDSLITQTYKYIELILVDDGSPDKCGDICEEYALKDSRIKVIHKKNGGLSDARNVALPIINGDYISFVDSDDWVSPYYIENLYNAIIKDESDLAISWFENVSEDKPIQSNAGNLLDSYESTNSYGCLKKMLYQDGVETSAWGKLYKKDNTEFTLSY